MKSEDEIAARLREVREKLTMAEGVGKAYAKEKGSGRSTLGIKSRRLLEGERMALAWVLGIPDPGPTPTVQ
jgi:hypothetical protein